MEESATVEIQEVVNLEEYSESQWEAYILEEPEANVSGNSEIEWERNRLNGNENQNGEVDIEANGSIGSEHQDRLLANDIKEMLESLEPPLSLQCCSIYRVPHDIRKLNEEAYTPKLLSIGPFHHGDKRLETMEKLKVKYLKRFVKEATLNVEDLVSYIRDREEDVRCCYAETSGLSSDNYVKMILVDASFIIVFFLALLCVQKWRTVDDFVVFTQRNIATIKEDLWLLENQLPFFVIEKLYNLAFASCSNYPSFTQLTFKFFEAHNSQKMSPNRNLKIKHFVDLLRTFFLPPQRLPQRNRSQEFMHLYTASQLHEAGVKFKVRSSTCLFDLKFTNGVLEIPCLKLYNETESLFRNLMALEQCYYRIDHYVTDYIVVLDFLINTTTDVDLLVRKEILVNWLGDNNAVTTLVNNLCSQIMYGPMNSDYCKVCKDLNTFYENPWHTWKATLKRDYFSTPWRIASIIAAFVLLALTFVQTVRSFY